MSNDQLGDQPKFKQGDVEQDPTVLKIHSVEELHQLIKHPETPEDVWVEACNELEKESAKKASTKVSARKINLVRIATIACGLLLVGAVALSVPMFEQALNTKPAVHTPKTAKQQAESEIQKYSAILQNDPNKFGALLNRGLAYIEIEKFDLAVSDCTKAMQVDPTRPGALNNRALAYRLAGQHQLALRDCNLLIKQFPEYSHGYAQRAQVYADTGQYPLAAKDMTKAIDLDPNRPGYYVGRESVYKKLGENDHFKAAEVDPTYFHERLKNK